MTSEKQVLCQSKTQQCMKNAQLCRNWLKVRTLARAVFPAKLVEVDRQLTSSCKNRFLGLGLSGWGLPLKFKWRREILFCGHALGRRHTGEFCHIRWWKNLVKLTGAELLVEHSHTAGGFAEAARTELCKGNAKINQSQMWSWIVQARIR